MTYWLESGRGKRVGVIIRVSDRGQVLAESPEVHKDRAETLGAQYGMNLIEFYYLPAVSGKSVLSHPEAIRLWNDIERRHINALLMTDLARMGRNMLELARIEQHLEKHNAIFLSTRERIDTSTPEGKEYFYMLANRAQTERLVLSKRVKEGRYQRALMGQITGKAPYGYHKVNRKLEAHPEQSLILQQIFSLYLKLKCLTTVANTLNDMGYSYENNKPFNLKSIKRVITEPAAKGVYYANTFHENGKPKPESEWIEIPTPALISEEDFNRCQKILNASYRQPTKLIYPYSGLLYCHCETKMYVRTSMNYKRDDERCAPRYECRNCGNKININVIDDSVGKVFKGFLIDHSIHAQSEISQAEQQIRSLNAELKKVKQGKSRWADAYEAGAIDITSFKSYHVPLLERESKLMAEIDRVKAQLLTTEDQKNAQQNFAKAIQSIAWGELGAQTKQGIMREFIESIILYPSDIQINMLFTPQFLEHTARIEEGDDFGFARLVKTTVKRLDLAEKPTDSRIWGYYLRQKRENDGLSVQDLAAQLSCPESRIMLWEQLLDDPWPQYLPGIIHYIGFVPWEMTPYIQTTMASIVRCCREIKGLTQKELADQLGRHKSLISLIENGKISPTPKIISKIENALDMPVRAFLNQMVSIAQ